MAHTSLSSVARPYAKPQTKARLWITRGAIALGVLLIVGFYFVSAHWPYRYGKIKPMLEDVVASQIEITQYHRTYFPNPGFVASGLTMRRKGALGLPPLGSVDKMVVQSSWIDLLLLRQRIQLVDITGMHIVVPAMGSRENHEDFPPGAGSDFDGPKVKVKVEHMKVHKSLLDVMRTDGNRYSFPIEELELGNVYQGEGMTYEVDMRNAFPTGRIHANGSFGPLNAKDAGRTPLTGDFSFADVDLSDVGAISGTLASSGHFNGTLGAIEAEASSKTPDFSVKNGKPTPVNATIHCIIYGTDGDLDIHRIDVNVGATTVRAAGSIAGSPKITNLDISVKGGRAQDLMRPFIQGEVPITGPVWLQSHAYVGPRGEAFLERLRMDGTFDVPAERISNQDTRKSLTEFSRRAQGRNATGSEANADAKDATPSTDAVSSLKGTTALRNGVVSTQRLTFKIPGAEADLKGTFDFHNEVVHLVGDLEMDTDLSHTTTGFKSLLLKPFAPFFKKKNVGAVFPIAVTGSPGRYKVSSDLTHKK